MQDNPGQDGGEDALAGDEQRGVGGAGQGQASVLRRLIQDEAEQAQQGQPRHVAPADVQTPPVAPQHRRQQQPGHAEAQRVELYRGERRQRLFAGHVRTRPQEVGQHEHKRGAARRPAHRYEPLLTLVPTLSAL